MAKRNRPDWWLPAANFRRIQAWLRRTVLVEIEREGEVMASPFVDRIAQRADAPEGYFSLGEIRCRKQVWNMINRLCEERRVDRFTPKRGLYLHLRLVNPLDRVVYALSEAVDDYSCDDGEADPQRT